MKIIQLSVYPIKSTHPIHLQSAEIEMTGIRYDRLWALFDSSGQVITGRDYPQLLDVKTTVRDEYLELYCNNKPIGSIKLVPPTTISKSLKIFSYDVFGLETNQEIDNWFSQFIGIPCKLMRADISKNRPVLAKHGGNQDDTVAFGDQAPLLILSEATMADLNSRLDKSIKSERFRPNILVTGCKPYAEDHWDLIQIGACKLRVIQQCIRCVFTTIDVQTKKKHPTSEPLRTLATYRKGPIKGVVLGVHAVPLNTGTINVGDDITVLSTLGRPVS